jgi:hypothetical protein
MCVLGPVAVKHTKQGKVKPVNPLAWWHGQRLAGEEHDGLTQMALDVLSMPGMYISLIFPVLSTKV